MTRVDVRKLLVVGATPGVYRRVGVVPSGVFESERLSGEVLDGGSWQNVHSGGSTTLGARIVLKTTDDALVGTRYRSTRHVPPAAMTSLVAQVKEPPSSETTFLMSLHTRPRFRLTLPSWSIVRRRVFKLTAVARQGGRLTGQDHSGKDLPCADRSWTTGSRIPPSGAIGGAQEKTRQAEQAEAHHAKAHGHEDVIEVCSEPDRGSATDDRDRRTGDSAGNGPSHAPRPLPGAVECVADPEKSEERPDGPKVGCPDRQDRRIAAE